MKLPDEICEECGKIITRRAFANVFGDKVVCTKCYSKLIAAKQADESKHRLISALRDQITAVIRAFPNHSKVTVANGFHSKLDYVTGTNEDGTHRQDLIRQATIGNQLFLMIEQSSNGVQGIGAWDSDARRFGFLNIERADMVMGLLACEVPVYVSISNLTGGTEDKPYRGVNIIVGWD